MAHGNQGRSPKGGTRNGVLKRKPQRAGAKRDVCSLSLPGSSNVPSSRKSPLPLRRKDLTCGGPSRQGISHSLRSGVPECLRRAHPHPCVAGGFCKQNSVGLEVERPSDLWEERGSRPAGRSASDLRWSPDALAAFSSKRHKSWTCY